MLPPFAKPKPGALMKRPGMYETNPRAKPVAPGQRRPRVENPKHLALIRQCPCVACGRDPCGEAAHLRAPNAAKNKPITGVSRKPDDQWTTPLCHKCHLDDQHTRGEMDFWDDIGIDPFDLAEQLYAAGDLEKMRSIVHGARRGALA
jgi:hypothetical protein